MKHERLVSKELILALTTLEMSVSQSFSVVMILTLINLFDTKNSNPLERQTKPFIPKEHDLNFQFQCVHF